MEALKDQGLVKYVLVPVIYLFKTSIRKICRSIGVSNFEVTHLELLLASAKIKPAANQVRRIRFRSTHVENLTL